MHIPPDWGIFAALIVSFLVFWFIFGRLFFGPFLRLISEREQRLKQFGERTEELLREEKAAVAAREAGLASVRHEALSRREAGRRQAEAEAAHMIGEARDTAKAELEQVRESIEQDFKEAASQLKQLADNLAVDLAGRVLGRSVSNGYAKGPSSLNQ